MKGAERTSSRDMFAAGHGGGYPGPWGLSFEVQLVNELVQPLWRIDRNDYGTLVHLKVVSR